MVYRVKCILEVKERNVQGGALSRRLFHDPVQGLDLPLRAAQTPEPLLGGVQQPMLLAHPV